MTQKAETNSHYDRSTVYTEQRKEPKHLFKVLGNKFEELISQGQRYSYLDVGGAAGELVDYFKQRFPSLEISCLEYDKKLYELGKERVKEVRFFNGDANDMNVFQDKQFNFVSMVGVMSIFDDFVPSLTESLRVAKDKGTVFVVGQFNEYAVDVLVRWRPSGNTGPYNPGRNLFSKKSVGDFLDGHARVASWNFEKFVLPFDLAPQKDLARSWTELDKDGQRVFKSGIEYWVFLYLWV
jgi:ubiquinone/menaquinone biosynthesis C-methylase UbiE